MADLLMCTVGPLLRQLGAGAGTQDFRQELPDSAWLMELPDSASVGPIGPLLRQLASAASNTNPGIQDLKEELDKLHVFLKDLYMTEDPSHTARWWMKEVRDLCHEIKDYCDEQAVRLKIPRDFTGFVAGVQAVSERAKSLQLTVKEAVTADLTPPLPVPAAPMDDLVKLLAFSDEKAKQLRVVTLFGFAATVNTTAARTVYDLYEGRFQCRAFVQVSADPDMRSILSSILSQIKAPPDDGFSDVDTLVRSVNNHLQHKRYLIVIDDLWSTPEQNFIMGAFPGGYCHSRIITTTRSKDVALASCDSYLQEIIEMTPLNSSETNQTLEWMKKELNSIYNELSPELKTCLLYLNMYQPGCTIRKDELVKQWIAEGLLCTANVDLLSQKKKKSHPIEKLAGDYFDELVSRELIQPVDINWNGEVMSYTVQHMVLDMIAWKCKEVDFITTVNYLEKTGLPDKAHRLSIQFRGEVDAKIPENIVLTKVRSLAFSGFYEFVPSLVECRLLQVLILHILADRGHGTFDLSKISQLFLLRYVKVKCNVTVNLPNKIAKLEHLETLEVDATIGTVPSDITCLSGLLHLCLRSANLPTGVSSMKSLRMLGCFDLSRNSEKDVKTLFQLENLEDLHLTCIASAAKQDDMQKKMDVMWSSIFSPNTSLKSVDLAPPGSNHVDPAFINTQDTWSDAGASCDVSTTEASTSASPSVLEQLELSPWICIFSSIPKRFAQLVKLRILKVAVRELSWADIDILRTLPALTALSLYVWITFGADKVGAANSENQKGGPQRLGIGKEGFPVLTYFKFTCPAPCLEFLPKAMQSVRRLKLRFNASSLGEYSLQCAGLENLTSLQEISVKIRNDGGSELHLRETQYALESAFPKHEVPPIVNMKSVDHIFGADKLERADIISSLPLEFSSKQQNLGVEESWRRKDDVHHAKATRLYLYIIGHKKYKFIQREKEQMIKVIEGNKEDNQGSSKEKWFLQLQELVYDIEDFIYNLSLLTMISSLMDIVGRMKHLKGRINTLRNWQYAAQWGQLEHNTAATSSAPLEYQTPPCYTPESDLIGIDGPKKELLGLMYLGDMKLRVISIVGCRGLGKSTLARAVYDDLRSSDETRVSHEPPLSIEHPSSDGEHPSSDEPPPSSEPGSCNKFQRFAWVVASDCNSSGDILNKIRQQFVPEEASNTTRDDYLLRRTLSKQRYILVIDQLQREELWYGIEDAFPKCNKGSRIIVTTSVQSVAVAATNINSIYAMPSLGGDDSKSLFWKKFYGRDTEPAPVLADGLESIFKKCDGLPLSLVTMARYFRQHHRTGRIERFGRFIGGEPEALGELNSALAQCYNGLPDNGHRACLLSLSIFPQGHQISRKSVIRRWVAEGMVAGDGVRNAEEVAADHFDEFIDRNIIEPVVIGNNSRVKRCRVRGLMLEFIVNKAISRNMVTLIREDETVPNKRDHLVRRLSVQDGTVERGRVATETGIFSAVRSLTIFKNVVFDLQSCKLLRILDLEGCTGINNAVLDAVCQLMILKYLSLRGTDVGGIPKRIRRLQYLETIDLRETKVEKLPIEVIMLPCLVHLFGKFDLPRELKHGKKKSKLHKFLSEKSRLQTVSGFVIDRNSGSEAIIIEARCVSKVKIWCKRYPALWSEDILVSALNRRFTGSSALESLSIDLDTYASPGFLQSLEAPCMLSSLKLSGQIGKLPDFLTSRATTLRELQLSSTGLSSHELSLLQKLPCLLYLKLYEDRRGFGSGEFVIDSNGFPSLERLCFQAATIPELDIRQGATTKLASLCLLCQEYPPSRVQGIQHLQHLSEVVLHGSLEASEVEEWKKKAMEHQNRPRVTKQAISS